MKKKLGIIFTERSNKGKTLLTIYETKDADSLKIYYDLSGKNFPKEFKVPKGTPLHLVDYRRQKDKLPVLK